MNGGVKGCSERNAPVYWSGFSPMAVLLVRKSSMCFMILMDGESKLVGPKIGRKRQGWHKIVLKNLLSSNKIDHSLTAGVYVQTVFMSWPTATF